MARFKVLGINDDKTFCECCGKNGLARVVWIEDTETGDIKHFGTSCAMKPAKGFDLDKEIKAEMLSHKAKMQGIYSRAWKAYRAIGGAVAHVMVKGSPETHATDKTLWGRCVLEAA